MRYSSAYIMFIIFFLFSCNTDKEKKTVAENDAVRKEIGFVNTDSTAPPEVFAAETPQIIPVLKTEMRVNPFGDGLGRQFFTNFGNEQGYSFGFSWDLFVDKTGMLWLATSLGAIKFDGINSTTYNKNNGLPEDYVSCITEDDAGNYWLGSGMGITKYDGKEFTNYDTADGLVDNEVRDIVNDKQGNIWIATQGGISKYNGKLFTNYTTQQGLPSNDITDLMIDNAGNIWLIARDTGLILYDGKSFKTIAKKDGLASEFVYSCFQDALGNIWICADKGLSKYDGKQFTHYGKTDGLPSDDVLDAAQDAEGNIWFATSAGLSKYDGNGFTNYRSEQGLINYSLRHLAIDQSGNIWCASFDGLSKLATPYLTNYTKAEGFLQDQLGTNDFVSDNANNLWFAISGGIGKYDGHTFFYYTLFNKDAENDFPVTDMLLDKHDNIWFLVIGKGRVQFDGRQFYFYSEKGWKDWISQPTCLQDSKANYWFPDKQGLLKFNGVSYTRFTTAQGLTSNMCTGLAEDRAGNIWIGTNNGISKYDGRRFTNFSTKQGLPSKWISSIIVDHKDHLWVGTGAGLSKYNGSSFAKYKKGNGLVVSDATIVTEDTLNKRIWLLTSAGLSAINTVSSARDQLQVEHFNFKTGYPVLGNYYGSAHLDKKGILWLSNDKGELHRFDYSHLKNTLSAKLVINNVTLDDETISWQLLAAAKAANNIHTSPAILNETSLRFGDSLSASASKEMIAAFTGVKFDSISKGDPIPYNLKIPFNHNSIGFHFAAIAPAYSNKIRYQSILEGYDKKWSDLGYDTKATFGNMSEGSYTFRVKALNPNGEWSETSYSFTVMPPWWRTALAYTMYVLLGGLFIYLINRREKKRHQKKNQRILKQKEAEQIVEMDKVKTRFFSNITHEFRTPLTMIISPIDQLMKEADLSGSHKNTLGTVQRNANQLLSLINQLLDLSKVEAGKMKVDYKRGDIGSFLAELAENFTPFAIQRNIRFNIKNEIPEADFLFDAGKWEMIINNLLSNAFKFTGENGTIEVVMLENKSADNPVVTLLVKDTGTGIEPEKLEHIFDRFYQADTSATRKYEGTGIGLALVKEFVDLMDGSIDLQSKLNEGTAIQINIPVAMAGNEDVEQLAFVPKTNLSPSVLQNDAPEESITTLVEAPLILVVEDNAELNKFITDTLQKKYRVISAADGNTAWSMCKEEIPDIVLSDVMMPGMDGNELCATIKSDPLTAHIAVMILSAKAAPDSKIAGLSQGADDYITKPFQVDELLLRIHNRLERLEKLKAYFRSHLASPEEHPEEPTYENTFIQTVYDTVDEFINDPQLGVEFLATKMAVSRRTLNRKLSALIGLPPSEIIKQCRLKKGASMLRSGNHISETAYSTGFESPSYFGQCFKEVYGLTPSEYIEKSRMS